ncbi:tryptophan synthase subunit alpha [Bacillus marinisedimentorum]|uniref:tryptophan synthase subunit alpha n=1 Tax=Bacillus marinisedimentorum TaxID=1821260 RepID=UPI0007E21CF2|nr:tryptophan synthase subunit alpha [Bacillus marinisedimentorum]
MKKSDLFIPFIMAGDPAADTTIEIAHSLEEAGADLLELGIPYSDPLADGPVIQEAANRALAGGMTLRKAIDLVPLMRQKGLSIPVVIFTYYNPVLQLGEERFIQLLKEKGANGLLVPDLPFEESGTLRKLAKEAGLEYISLVAPNSNDRIQKIASQAEGFLYCVSSLGVTGERSGLNEDVGAFLEIAKKHSRVPVAVGFGVSSPDQVKMLNRHCDGVIIGSKIVKMIKERSAALQNPELKEEALASFREDIKQLLGRK